MSLIKVTQQKLKDAGCNPGPIDGDWGPRTQTAMDDFQRMKKTPIPLWLLAAERELGVHEIAGPRSNARVLEYHQHTTLKASDDDVPWCSAFANYCMDITHNPATHSAAALSWLNWGTRLTDFRYGAVAIFSRGQPGQGHVAFAVAMDEREVITLGGNQSDCVCVQSHSRAKLLQLRFIFQP